ncbi:MAG: amino acid permease, partial [Sphingomonadales bacterium]
MLYGVGSMLGAGIYGLVGKAAGLMGGAVWLAFLVAMVAALLTGISYASIASRYPKAAGAAYAAQRAYRAPWLSYVIGLAVVCSGLASIATQSKVVAENLNLLLGLNLGFTIGGAPGEILALSIGFLMLIAAIVYRGITESLWANALCTLIEALGLLLVVAVGARFWGDANLLEVPGQGGGMGALTAGLILQGSVLTFFSFLGFEDMLNVAEEVERPERTMPIALIGAMVFASLVYIAVSITAVSVVPWSELAAAPGPLRLVIERAAPWFPAIGFTFITIAAVANTALVNYVMGSRLLYGMARQGLLPGHPVE